jgi:hypothetical protein
MCQCRATFVFEPTLPAQPWTRLAPEDALLAAFLPVYIRHQNHSQHEPLLTLENWHTLARSGRLSALAKVLGRCPICHLGQLVPPLQPGKEKLVMNFIYFAALVFIFGLFWGN